MKYIVRLQVEEEIEVDIPEGDEDAEDNAISEAVEQADQMFTHRWQCLGVRKQ